MPEGLMSSHPRHRNTGQIPGMKMPPSLSGAVSAYDGVFEAPSRMLRLWRIGVKLPIVGGYPGASKRMTAKPARAKKVETTTHADRLRGEAKRIRAEAAKVGGNTRDELAEIAVEYERIAAKVERLEAEVKERKSSN